MVRDLHRSEEARRRYLAEKPKGKFGVHQYTPEEWGTTPDLWLRKIHPDDVERVKRENDLSNRTGEPFRRVDRVADLGDLVMDALEVLAAEMGGADRMVDAITRWLEPARSRTACAWATRWPTRESSARQRTSNVLRKHRGTRETSRTDREKRPR